MRRLCAIVILTLWAGSEVRGQAITGIILGTVVDITGAVVSGVVVTATHVGTNLKRTSITNESGNFSIPNTPVGTYRVEAEAAGFRKEVRVGIALQIDSRARVDIVMQPGQITEFVEVTSGVPLIQMDDSFAGTVIDERTVAELPLNGRQFESLVQLVPGAVTAASGSHLSSRGGFNVSGMDEHYNSFFLDGIDNVDPIVRNFSFRPSIDLIQEFKVYQSGYNAEFGRNAGAVINATTKSGTNEFHGSVWEFLRNDYLDARNYFAEKGTPKPPLIRNQFGAAIGGPIKADRTFFFAAYEGSRYKVGTARRASVPTLQMRRGNLSELTTKISDPQNGGLPFPDNIIPENRIHPMARAALNYYPPPNLAAGLVSNNRAETGNRIEDVNDISLKFDHHVSSSLFSARYSYSAARVLDTFREEGGGPVVQLSNFGQVADRLRTNAGVSLTTASGSNFVNEFRFGYNRFNQPQIPVNSGPPELQPLQGYVQAFVSLQISGYAQLGSGALSKRAVNVYNYIDNVSYRAGNHQFKAGVDVRRYLLNAVTVAPNSFTFDGSRTGSGFSDFLLGLPGITRSVDGNPAGNTRKFEIAWFLQEDWKVNSRLTLNYGIRWEFYGRISEKVNKQSTWIQDCNCVRQAGAGISQKLTDNDWNNFAPRLGFAWKPFNSDRTVLRGSGGIFYDSDMRHNFQFIANPPFLVTHEYRAAQVPTLSLDNPFPPDAGNVTLAPFAMPPHYVDTYAENWTLGVQRELPGATLLDVAYVGNHTLKAQRLRNLNQPINGVRPYAGFGTILMAEQSGSSIFHSMQVRFERRLAQGISFISSYTWGHAIDDRPGQGGLRPQNNYDLKSERGDADFDARHRWSFSGLYQLPFGTGQRFGSSWRGTLNAILGGWGLGGSAAFQGGRPFTINLDRDNSQTLGSRTDRPNLVSGVSLVPENQGPNNWINRAAFTMPEVGMFGSSGRNIGRGPQLHNVDLALVRNGRAGENVRVQFRVEFFNLFNHPNFALPATSFDSALFGAISATATPERQIQFGMRVRF